MRQLPDTIAQLCQVHMGPEREKVVQASEDTFAVFSPESFTAYGGCVNGTLLTCHISKVSMIQVAGGCSLRLRHHTIESPFSVMTPSQPIVTRMNWDTFEVPKEPLKNVDCSEMKLYQFLLKEYNLSSQVEDGLQMSHTQLAILHDRLSRQVQESQAKGIWVIITVGILLGVMFTIIMHLIVSCYFCPKPILPPEPTIILPPDLESFEDKPQHRRKRASHMSTSSLPSREASF